MFKLNSLQQYAKAQMKSGKNIFLTGGAGVGKSAIINDYISEYDPSEIMICAPTGIAALNINGVTCHRAFKMPVKPLVEKPKVLPSALKDVKTVIIDEISMLRIDAFEYIAFIISSINLKRQKSGEKPIQLIVVGDFFQLPPVITDNDRNVLSQFRYGDGLRSGFAFQSKFWEYLNFEKIELTEVIRQTNREFSGYLNEARIGNPYSIQYFNNMSNAYEIDDAILLCATNKKVNDKNDTELAKIKSKEFVFNAKITGTVNESDKLVPDELKLKVGCRVMTVINDNVDGFYQNGTLATVKEIYKDRVFIETDDGIKCDVFKYTWEIKSYSGKENKSGKMELKEDIIGTYTQFPLRLGYAITIHKSQGKTFDKVNLDPYCWDFGQLYVALSRVKTISGLHLTQPIRRNNLVCSDDVRQFYNL